MTLVQTAQMQSWADKQVIQKGQVQLWSETFGEVRQMQMWADQQFVQKAQQQSWSELSPAYVAAIGPQAVVNPTQPPPPPNPVLGAKSTYAAFTAPRFRVWIQDANLGSNFFLCDHSQNILENFEVTVRKNAGVSWSASIIFAPQFLKSIGLQTLLAYTAPSSFAGDNNIAKRVFVQVLLGGETIQLPQLVILKRHYESRPDGFVLTISGTDVITRLMNKRNFNQDSYVSTTAALIMAKYVLQTFLPQFNVGNFILNFDDFPIRTLHIQNERPVDILNQILEIPRAFWFVQGSTLVTAPWTIANNPNWIYQDVPNLVTQITMDEDAFDLINTVKVTLQVPAGIKGATMTQQTYGRFVANFTFPLLRPQMQIEQALNGQFLFIDYFDKNGNWIAHFEPGGNPSNIQFPPGVGVNGWGGNGEASSVAVVWTPPPVNSTISANNIVSSAAQAATAFQVYWRGSDPLDLILSGFIPPQNGPYTMPTQLLNSSTLYQNGTAVTTTPPANQPVNPDQQFSVIVEDSGSVAQYGILEAEHPVGKALIPNLPWAWRYGVGVLQESGRLRKQYEVFAPINPLLNVGDTVQVIDNVRGENVIGLVEEHMLRFDSSWAESRFKMVVYSQ